MNIYANAFRVSTKHDLSEVIITLIQESPSFDLDSNEESEQCTTVAEVVGSYIMTAEGARKLGDSLCSLLPEIESAETGSELIVSNSDTE